MARERIHKTIMIDRKSYFYLNAIMREQRGCKPLGDEGQERMWKRLGRERGISSEGLVQVDEDSFGGGDGTYDGKWWSWSVDTLKRMLTDAGMTWQAGEDMRCIDI